MCITNRFGMLLKNRYAFYMLPRPAAHLCEYSLVKDVPLINVSSFFGRLILYRISSKRDEKAAARKGCRSTNLFDLLFQVFKNF